jgi:circadian clock protein KaiB
MKPTDWDDEDTNAFEQALTLHATAQPYYLKLFVSGSTPRSLRAIQNIRTFCEERLRERYTIEVVDVYQHPDALIPDQIVVTPTLIRELPLPIRKIVGDLSDREQILLALEIISGDAPRKSPSGDDDVE